MRILHDMSETEKNVIKKVVWPGSTQLAPVPSVLVACGGTGEWKPNLITIAWAGVLICDHQSHRRILDKSANCQNG